MPSKTVQYRTGRTHPFSLIVTRSARTRSSGFCCQDRSKAYMHYLIKGQTCQLMRGITALREEQRIQRGYPNISVVFPALNETQNHQYVLSPQSNMTNGHRHILDLPEEDCSCFFRYGSSPSSCHASISLWFGDEAITLTSSFAATINAILLVDATSAFIDT